MRLVIALILLALLAAPRVLAGTEERPADEFIGKAAAVGDRLLFLSDTPDTKHYFFSNASTLVAYGLRDGERTSLSPISFMDMTVEAGVVWTLSTPWVYFAPATVYRLDGDALFRVSRTPTAIGTVVAFDVVQGRVYVVGLKGVAVWTNAEWTIIPLSGVFERPWAPVARVTADHTLLYLGDNRGEWGGSLYRVDLATGDAAAWKDLNVTAILRHPARAACVLVGVGISHFLTSGDVRELCGDDTKIVFSRKLPPTLDTNGKPLPNQSCQDCTYPIFGMAIAPDESVWAVSAGLVLFHLRDGDAEEVAMPEPEDWHGLMLNRPTPGLIALWTMANARVSLSGTTPLLVRVDSTE